MAAVDWMRFVLVIHFIKSFSLLGPVHTDWHIRPLELAAAVGASNVTHRSAARATAAKSAGIFDAIKGRMIEEIVEEEFLG